MKEKYKIALRILLVIIIMICAFIIEVFPNYQKSQGSSDSYIDIKNYTDIVEIKINNNPNFALVITQYKISNILFFDYESLCLYNKDIEGTNIEEGIPKIIELLIENSYLESGFTVTITNYKEKSYERTKQVILDNLQKQELIINLSENKSSIKLKAKSLNIKEEDESLLLRQIELTSKEYVRRYKNDISYQKTPLPKENITQDNSKEYTDAVYRKIENYMHTNSVENQDISNTTLQITKIPANINGTLFPDDTSWYYIKNRKVYAYISITIKNTSYSYCYQSSIDDYKKGPC